MADVKTTVGFVGLGNMGQPMSRRLVEGGYRVIGYDVSEEARRRAVINGVHEAGELADVAGAGILILMLPNSAIVAEVLHNQALLGQLAPGSLVIDMSSSEPMRTRQLASSLVARGVRMVDAPVSGGVAGAQAGKLTVIVGGEAEDVERARHCLERFGRVVHAGAIGSGHAIKALNNLLSATHLWATSEVMLTGSRFGIDPEVMLEALNTSSGRSGSSETKWPNFILPGTFDSGFSLRLMVKDMGTAVELAKQLGTPSMMGETALALWAQAAEDLPPTADHTEVAKWLGSR